MPAQTRPTQAYWADEIAGQVVGRQVVNDSKTPSGTVHVGSLRGVVLHDAVRRALLEPSSEVEFRYGVEDLDPMDSQALLTPDAIEKYMGVPLSHVPAPDGSPHPELRAPLRDASSCETFAELGIHPRLYWMSEQYGSGAMDPYIAKALDKADVILEIYRTVSTVNHPAGWLPISVICENCGKIGTTARARLGRREVAYSCLPDLVDWATRLRLRRSRVAVRRPRQARLERGLGRALGTDRRHDRGLRQGPRHGRRLARPRQRDQPPGLRARAAARHPVRVPQPRRAQDEHVQGRRRRRARDRRASAADDPALPLPALPAEPRHQLRSVGRHDPAPVRRVRPFRRLGRRQAVRGELPPDADRIFALSLADPEADPIAEANRYRPPFGHLALLLQVPGPGRAWSASTPRRGRRSTTTERKVALERIAAAEAWLRDFAPTGVQAPDPLRRHPSRRCRADRRSARPTSLRLPTPSRPQDPPGGEAWQALIFDTSRISR